MPPQAPGSAGGPDDNKLNASILRRVADSYGPIKLTFNLNARASEDRVYSSRDASTSPRSAASSNASSAGSWGGVAPSASNPDAQAIGQGAWERQLQTASREEAAVRVVRVSLI